MARPNFSKTTAFSLCLAFQILLGSISQAMDLSECKHFNKDTHFKVIDESESKILPDDAEVMVGIERVEDGYVFQDDELVLHYRDGHGKEAFLQLGELATKIEYRNNKIIIQMFSGKTEEYIKIVKDKGPILLKNSVDDLKKEKNSGLKENEIVDTTSIDGTDFALTIDGHVVNLNQKEEAKKSISVYQPKKMTKLYSYKYQGKIYLIKGSDSNVDGEAKAQIIKFLKGKMTAQDFFVEHVPGEGVVSTSITPIPYPTANNPEYLVGMTGDGFAFVASPDGKPLLSCPTNLSMKEAGLYVDKEGSVVFVGDSGQEIKARITKEAENKQNKVNAPAKNNSRK